MPSSHRQSHYSPTCSGECVCALWGSSHNRLQQRWLNRRDKRSLLQLTPYPLDALLLAVVYINRVTHLTPPRPVAQDTIGSCPVRSFRPLLDTCQQQLPLHDPAAATANKSAWCATDDKFGGYSTATRSDVGPPSFEEHSPSVTRQVAGTSPPPPPLTRYTAHRLMLAALVVAARYGSDYNITRVRAAKVAGLPVDELFLLELDFFALLSFGCRVRSTELEAICAELWYRTNAGKQEQAGRPADARSAADVPTDGGEPRLCGSDDNDREDVRNRSSVEFCFTPPARRMSGYADKRLPGRFPLSPGGPFDVDGTPSATPPLSEGESDSSYFSSSSLSSTDEGREYGSLDCKATAPSASRTVTPTLISQLSIS